MASSGDGNITPREGGSSPRRRPAVQRSPPPTDGRGVARFRDLDRYRVEREWARYEGNPLRDLFRELRARFVRRHLVGSGWVLDVGAGPGRFTPLLGAGGARPIVLDLSLEMVRRARRSLKHVPGAPGAFVRADAAHPPFRSGSVASVAALGNVVGYMPSFGWPSMEPLAPLVAPSGLVLLEIVPGFGERSVYLTRLPPGAVARALRSPTSWVVQRVEKEGFARVLPEGRRDHGFRRLAVDPLLADPPKGWQLLEAMAVAPALGFDMDRLGAIQRDPASWKKLLRLEEELGRAPDRWPHAAALLLALSAPPP